MECQIKFGMPDAMSEYMMSNRLSLGGGSFEIFL
jgi:hypothetical protein